ncbi:MAG TPA: ABC transporter permease [Terriglobales bacterium]|nr:ABC transporter permease [Terriglobales bacterium]
MGLWGSIDRTKKDRDFTEEIESHLAHEEDANLGWGLSPEDARRRARLRFGNPRTWREREWRSQSVPWIEDLWRDLRFALRALRKEPGFVTIAVVVIAVGIGLNAAVFSVIDAVLLKPLPYPDPHQLVLLVPTVPRWASSPGGNIPRFNLLRQQTGVFQQVAAYDFGNVGLNITGSDNPLQLHAVHVTADYFALFGASFIAGRTFTAAEDSPNGGHVAVLSYGLWKSRYGANPNIVGSSIQLDDQPYRVVGVVDGSFATDTPIDLWVPFQFDLTSKDWAQYFRIAARLKPGMTVSHANAQLRSVLDEFHKSFVALAPLEKVEIGDSGPRLLVLWGAVAFVLLIACANVANLLLARGAARSREFSTRAALGAGRVPMIRQLLVESLMLSLSGGLIGLGVGFATVRILLRINPGDIPRIGQGGARITLDLHIVLFTFGISVLAALVCGLIPAINASRGNLAAALHENGSHATLGIRRGKLRSALVIAEMAITILLIIGAALLIRTFRNLEAVDPGFTMHNVITMSMSVSGERFQKTAPVTQVIQEGTDRLHTVPGIIDAGVSNCLPMVDTWDTAFRVIGRPLKDLPFTGKANFCLVSFGYFSTLEIPLRRGRMLTERDDATSPQVVIINQAMARQYWPDGDPLRDRLLVDTGLRPALVDGIRQVIGIVGDTHDDGPNSEAAPMMYVPLTQIPDQETAMESRWAPLWWFVRTQTDPHNLTSSIAGALRERSGGLPVGQIRTMEELEARNIARQRLNMLLVSVFGCAGLLMAAIGIYGVMSYSVQQRTQELGVRMAVGAKASKLRNMVIRQGMTLTLVGALIGTSGALWLTHFLASLLFEVKPLDPVSFIAAPLVSFAVSLLSTWMAAIRATRVNPSSALRID